ncbi:SseB family protein [Microbacterium lacticum]
MALFSRRDKGDRSTPASGAPASGAPASADSEAAPGRDDDGRVDAEASAAAPVSAAPVPGSPVDADAAFADAALAEDDAETADAPETPAEPVPHVGISVNTFGRGAETARPLDEVVREASATNASASAATTGAPTPAPARPRPAATAPAPSETIPGLVDNALLQAALAALPESPQAAHIMNVMRQALQGQLYLRAQGDAQALIAAGQGLNLAVTTHEDKRYLLVFSSGEAMRQSVAAEAAAATADSATSVVGQAAHNVFRTAIDSGYDGVYLDHANTGARLVLPIELVKKSLEDGAPVPFELKALLSGERTEETPAAIAEVLTRVPVWVAGGTDPSGAIGLAEARTEAGERRLEVYSHPLEVIAMGRGDSPLPLTTAQLATTLASEPALTGIVLDPAGPWIELDRDDLAAVLALAD